MVYYYAAKVGFSNGVIAMPLTKRQFELGIDDEAEHLMRQAYQMLTEYRDLAYSARELQEAILRDDATDDMSRKLNHALDVLAEIGAADKGVVEGAEYYAFLAEFDTNTWDRDLSVRI